MPLNSAQYTFKQDKIMLQSTLNPGLSNNPNIEYYLKKPLAVPMETPH